MKRNQKGFTLMELMVVIVIVAILAAVAVPLYINYVKDASRTEAKGAIGAIITAEQTYNQQNPQLGYFAFADGDIDGWAAETDPTARLNCDITEARVNWEFKASTDNGFTVTADGKTGRPTDGLQVIYQLRNTPTWQEH